MRHLADGSHVLYSGCEGCTQLRSFDGREVPGPQNAREFTCSLRLGHAGPEGQAVDNAGGGRGGLAVGRRLRHRGRQVFEIAVAIRALQRRVLVYDDFLAFKHLGLLVALVTRHVSVPTGER